ncbi:MAG: hypothetical protein DCC75_06425 [Proteobacteria bacterium]|nr:MAG: hypothetical protein DCC75_06425 [Pseudomonadota bacterium]
MAALLWILVTVFAGFYICGPIQDPDLWWHITVGRWILHHGKIPAADHWGLFSAGEPWRAYSWSNEIVYALFDQTFGIYGLLVLKLLIAASLALSLSYCFSRLAGDWFLGACLGVFSTAACYNHFTLRPQSIVWILFVWLIFWAERISREGLSPRSAAALIGIMALWSNSHLSAVLGLAVLCGWLLPGANWRSFAWRGFFLTLAFFIAGTLLTPYLGGEWITFFRKAGHPLQFETVSEFQPATILQYSTAFLILSLAFMLALLHKNPGAISPVKGVLCGIFCCGALAVVKFLPMAVILNCAVIAHLWERQGRDLGKLGNLAEAIVRLKGAVFRIPREGLAFVVVCLGIVELYQRWTEPILEQVVPKKAVDFIQANGLPHPIMNVFGYGGYLIYRFSNEKGEPVQRIALDGRTNLIEPAAWEKFSSIFRGRENWKEYLEYVKPETILWRSDSPLKAILLNDSSEERWCLVYEEGVSTQEQLAFPQIFVKRSFLASMSKPLPSRNC